MHAAPCSIEREAGGHQAALLAGLPRKVMHFVFAKGANANNFFQHSFSVAVLGVSVRRKKQETVILQHEPALL